MSELAPVNVLLVDDRLEQLLVLETVLAELEEFEEGVRLVRATSGEEALQHVLEHEFAVILLDVNMPGMDGFETASFIRRRKKSAHTPIIFVTCFADEMLASRGYSLGAVDYILAPVVPEVLRSKVKVFVDLFRMNQQSQLQADQRVKLAREQAARAAAEEATARSNFLAEASRVLSSSLDFETTLRALGRIAVPALAELSGITRIDEHGRLGPTEFLWQDGQGELRTALTPDPAQLPPPLGAALDEVAAARRTAAHCEIGSWPLVVGGGVNDGAPVPVDVFPFNSAVMAPLVAGGQLIAVMTLAVGPSGRRYRGSDIALAEDLAGRAEVALDHARLYQNIREADRRKDEFLAMLAHELRNPLAPIRYSVQLFSLAELDDPVLTQACEVIDRQISHMARLIDDLLDVSRLSRGKILLRRQPLDLVELVRSTTHDMRSTLEEQQLQLDVELPGQPLYVHGDATRLAQVLSNVLHNANKFTDPGGRVAVELAAEPQEAAARIVVRDTGIGMESDMLRRAFETFSQADHSLDRSRGGLGLGLALVKGLIELHGGSVCAASDGLGAGTEIAIRLPLVEQPALANEKPAKPASPDSSFRILIVEDNPDTAESLRLVLSLTGNEVSVALDGRSGLDMARGLLPEVVLCDIGLPGGLDGYAVGRELRLDPRLNSAYLIATTGYGQDDDRRRSREAGFDAHLTKPVDLTELRQLLRSLPARL